MVNCSVSMYIGYIKRDAHNEWHATKGITTSFSDVIAG